MTKNAIAAAALSLTALFGAGTYAVAQTASAPANAPANAPTSAPAAAPQTAAVPAPMSIQDLLGKLTAQGYTDVSEVERKGDKLYEVKARDAQGRRMEMKVDARTAEILHSEQD